MVFYKIEEEIELLRESNCIVCMVFVYVGSMLWLGMIGVEIDKVVEELIWDYGGVFLFKGYQGFLGSLCVFVNEQVVYGIFIKDQVFQDGDIVLVDCGVYLNGFYGDFVYIFLVGEVDEVVMEFCWVINIFFYKGIDVVIVGNCIGDIGFVI